MGYLSGQRRSYTLQTERQHPHHINHSKLLGGVAGNQAQHRVRNTRLWPGTVSAAEQSAVVHFQMDSVFHVFLFAGRYIRS